MAQTLQTTEEGTRFRFLGQNQGSITFTNPETNNSYRAGQNARHRYIYVRDEDLAWIKKQSNTFALAPDEPATESSETPTKAGSPATHWAEGIAGLSDAAVAGLKDSPYTSLEQALAATDDELDAIPGIGPSTIAKLRELA